MGQHKKPLSDIVTDPDVFTSWKDEKNFVEETETLKTKAAGAGLTDND